MMRTSSMRCFFFVLTLCYIASTTECCVSCDEDIYQYLFGDGSYISQVKPSNVTSGEALNVSLSFTISNLLGIDEKEEKMQVMGFFTMAWFDNRLTWNPSDFGNTSSLVVPAQTVWLPDVIMSNSGNSFYEYSFKRDFLIAISFNGSIVWEYGGVLTTNCDINMRDYPFDSQNCPVDVETWRYSMSAINLYPSGIYVQPAAANNALWNLTSVEATVNVVYSSFIRISFQFVWQRRQLYYYFNIIIPAFLMLVVALGVFWLPVESGEKISLAVTILLAFSVFLIIIMDNTPVNSLEIPLLTKFVILLMCITTLSLITSIGITYLGGKLSNQRAPKWARTLCFRYIGKALFMGDLGSENEGLIHKDKDPVVKGLTYEMTTSPEGEIVLKVISASDTEQTNSRAFWDEYGLKQISADMRTILDRLDEKIEGEKVKDEWTAVGRVVDRLLFWLVILLLIILLPLIFLKKI